MREETKELLVRIARVVATEVCKVVLSELEKPRETVIAKPAPQSAKEIN